MFASGNGDRIKITLGKVPSVSKPLKKAEVFDCDREEQSDKVRTKISSVSQIGNEVEWPKPIIPCSKPLVVQQAVYCPPEVIDPAHDGIEKWLEAKEKLQRVSLGPENFGLISCTNEQRPPAVGFLKNANRVEIGPDAEYKVEIESYGIALLRGMGYTEDREVHVNVPKQRAYNVAGLGAEKAFQLLPPKTTVKKRSSNPEGDIEDL